MVRCAERAPHDHGEHRHFTASVFQRWAGFQGPMLTVSVANQHLLASKFCVA